MAAALIEGESAPSGLVELMDTYSQCLNLSRQFAARTITDDPEAEVDLDALEQFLSARAELFASAEANLNHLDGNDSRDPARQELNGRLKAVLEEMAETENQLSAFLNERLARMRRTIGQMKKAQPVFRRYGYLGGPMSPSRITRHE